MLQGPEEGTGLLEMELQAGVSHLRRGLGQNSSPLEEQ